MAPTATEITADADAPTKYQKRLREWIKNDGMAQRYIVTSMENTPMLHIINCTTAHEMWEKLHRVYENKTETSVHMLQQEWFKYSKDPNDDLSTHISKLQDLCHKLKALGETISDSMLITKILMTLPEQYNHFVSAWESTDAAQRTIDNKTARLVMEESRRKTQENNQDVALLANKVKSFSFAKDRKNKNENSKSDKTNYKNKECYNCKLKGHIKKDCWFLEENKHKRPAPSSQKSGKPGGNSEDRALIGEILLTVDPNINTKAWLLDSGATSHMCGNGLTFTDYTLLEEAIPVKLGDGHFVHGIGRGNIEIQSYDGKRLISKYLKDVLHVPGIKFNLFSMGAALAKQICCKSTNLECVFYKNDVTVAIAERSSENDLFKMKFRLLGNIEKCNVVNAMSDENIRTENNRRSKPDNDVNKKERKTTMATEHKKINTLQLWHERLAHQNVDHVKRFLTQNNVEVDNTAPFCDACVLGKMHRLPFPQSESKTLRVGELVHADLCGPMEVNSLGNSKYFFLLKDDYSSFVKIYFIKNKSQVKDYFENFLLRFENETGKKVNVLRTDNGLEFINKEMAELTNKYGIKHERTVAYTPEQNGKAERENRTLIEAARTTLLRNSLNKNLWAEAINSVAYILYRTRKTNVEGKTPFEIWFNKRANFRH